MKKWMLEEAQKCVEVISDFGRDPDMSKWEDVEAARARLDKIERRLERSGWRLGWRGNALVLVNL